METKRIALTGGIACGKSTFAGMLADLGCEVLDTDALVHDLESPGGGAVARIVAAFGPAAQMADGSIDRGWLARQVFGDAAARARLNAIVHPLVREAMDRWLRAPAAGNGIKVVVVPLLFEAGWTNDWDVIVCVVCREDEQLRRLRERDLNEMEARARIAAQMPLPEKARRADLVIHNDGVMVDLRAAARRLVAASMKEQL